MIPLAPNTEVVALVRQIILGTVGDTERDDRTRHLVHQCASSARRNGVRSEQLVVAIREAWRAEPAVHRYVFEDYGCSLITLTSLIAPVLDAYHAQQVGGPVGNSPST
jgi:hypothetical protein